MTCDLIEPWGLFSDKSLDPIEEFCWGQINFFSLFYYQKKMYYSKNDKTCIYLYLYGNRKLLKDSRSNSHTSYMGLLGWTYTTLFYIFSILKISISKEKTFDSTNKTWIGSRLLGQRWLFYTLEYWMRLSRDFVLRLYWGHKKATFSWDKQRK